MDPTLVSETSTLKLKDLTTVSKLAISLTSGPYGDGDLSAPTKYSIRDESEVEILYGRQVETSEPSPLKTIMLTNIHGQHYLNIVHRVGLSVVSICSTKGKFLGETTVAVSFGCCCTIKPRYTYRLKSGKDMFVMDGQISCGKPRLRVKVLGEKGNLMGSIQMGNTLSFQCDVQFLPNESTAEERLFIVALCVGMVKIDSTYEKSMISGQLLPAGESKAKKKVWFRIMALGHT